MVLQNIVHIDSHPHQFWPSTMMSTLLGNRFCSEAGSPFTFVTLFDGIHEVATLSLFQFDQIRIYTCR